MDEKELLFTEVLKCDRLWLYLNKDKQIDKQGALFISSALKKRISGEPLQYILGKADFMGLEFKLTPDVLIPRPETEILVETAVNRLQAASRKPQALNILELGTGSGCIAVSLAKFLPCARITATDISTAALEVAKENARLNNVEDRIEFIQGDLFSACSLQPAACSVIISNPPYIPTAQIDKLQPEIKYEPRIALDGGRDGLDFYRRIIKDSPSYLKEGGFLILEIGFNQREAVEKIVYNSVGLKIAESAKDYNNMDRVIIVKKVNKNG